MKRAGIVAAALGLLLPGLAAAQQPEQQVKPGGPPPPGNNRPAPRPPGRPAPPPPGRPAPPPMHTGRPMPAPGRGPTPVYVRPLPPRGNQYWHRGQYYGRIHGPAFAYPPGWRYRQWSIGQRLPPLFVAPNYYYPDWAALGLQAPPPGYSWVRFGPDLILVNLTTDEIEDVIYGVFQ